MKFAGRMNSFMFKGNYDLFQTIDAYRNLPGITHLEFNYPEHLKGYDLKELRQHMGSLGVNGVALRFRGNEFMEGEFAGTDSAVSRQSVRLCKEAADACQALGGQVITIWLGFDGFDYPFQVDYEKNWNIIVRSFQEIADYAGEKGIKVSIEYKPCEPRAFSMIDGIGLTLQMIDEVDRPNIGVTLDFCHMLMLTHWRWPRARTSCTVST